MQKNKLIKDILIVIFSLVLVFQFLLLFGVIPYEHTWGGRLKSWEEMVVFVSFSILVNVLFLFATLVKAGYLKIAVSSLFLKIVFWAMFVIFALNTIGNLFAVSHYEKYIATPITLLLSFMAFRVATEKDNAAG